MFVWKCEFICKVPGWKSKYWPNTKLADQVRNPVVPVSMVVRDSNKVAMA